MAEAQSERFRQANPAPESNIIINFFVTGFFTLSTERSMSSNGIGMIPYSKVLEYAEWVGVKDVTRFLKVIQSIDAAYVSEFYKKLESKMAQK